MFRTLPEKILQNLSRKRPIEKKVPWHRCGPGRSSGSNCNFCQKNAFFGQKKAFFQKVHFIQKWSVTQNTVFQCIKKYFLLSHPKLVFFTRFYLSILLLFCVSTYTDMYLDIQSMPHIATHHTYFISKVLTKGVSQLKTLDFRTAKKKHFPSKKKSLWSLHLTHPTFKIAKPRPASIQPLS